VQIKEIIDESVIASWADMEAQVQRGGNEADWRVAERRADQASTEAILVELMSLLVKAAMPTKRRRAATCL
jgi:hypothetical protein